MKNNSFLEDASTLIVGPELKESKAALILLHGRGADAESILELYPELEAPHLTAIAPQADENTWYPYSFLSPLTQNQPYLDIALAQIASIVNKLLAENVAPEKIALLGFSQGACLALEFAARNPRHFGAVIGLSGGLIGPTVESERYVGAFSGASVFLGSSDPDPHVPWERVQESETVLTGLGAVVDIRRYPRMPHAINHDELLACRSLLQKLET